MLRAKVELQDTTSVECTAYNKQAKLAKQPVQNHKPDSTPTANVNIITPVARDQMLRKSAWLRMLDHG